MMIGDEEHLLHGHAYKVVSTRIFRIEIVNKMVPEKMSQGSFLMEETERLKSMMGKEFESLGSVLKKKWQDKLDGDCGCCSLRA